MKDSETPWLDYLANDGPGEIEQLKAQLETAQKALEAVASLITCASVTMEGKIYLRFRTTRQNEVAHQVRDALAQIGAGQKDASAHANRGPGR